MSDWRPVRLTAFVKHEKSIYRYDEARALLQYDRTLAPLPSRAQQG